MLQGTELQLPRHSGIFDGIHVKCDLHRQAGNMVQNIIDTFLSYVNSTSVHTLPSNMGVVFSRGKKVDNITDQIKINHLGEYFIIQFRLEKDTSYFDDAEKQSNRYYLVA